MNEKLMKNLLDRAINTARRLNDAYDKENRVSIDYNTGYLDCIMNILNINDNAKWYTYETDSDYEKVTCIKIKKFSYDENKADKVETITI